MHTSVFGVVSKTFDGLTIFFFRFSISNIRSIDFFNLLKCRMEHDFPFVSLTSPYFLGLIHTFVFVYVQSGIELESIFLLPFLIYLVPGIKLDYRPISTTIYRVYRYRVRITFVFLWFGIQIVGRAREVDGWRERGRGGEEACT